MITISNGWMNNTVSFSRIMQIANAAREHASQRNRAVSDVLIDHSRDMDFGEKLYDYLCCGSVKKQFMDYLYQMAHDRTSAVMTSKSCLRPNQEPTEFQSKYYPDYIRRETSAATLKVKELMAGNSLRFCRWSIQNEQNGGDFLIYRRKSQRTALGIPVTLPDSPPPQSLNNILTTSTPTFQRAGDIQLRHLKAILQRGRVILGGQSYPVRCTKKNEPVVMLTEDLQQTAALQERLRNLWAIGNVKKRLVDLTGAPLPITRLEASAEQLPEIQNEESNMLHRDKLRRFTDDIQHQFSRSVEQRHNRLIDECVMIRGELDRIERMPEHTLADSRDFLQFQEKLRALETSLQEATELIGFVKDRLNWIYLSIKINTTLELLAPRVLKATEAMVRLFRSRWDSERIKEFRIFFDAQFNFIEHFNPDTLTNFVFPSYLASGQLRYVSPTIFTEKYDRLLSMANDASCTWQQFSAERENLATELNAQSPLKFRQVDMAQDLHRSLDRYVNAGSCQIVLIYQSNFSPESNKYKNLLLQLLETLMDPNKNFTSVELDDTARKIKHYSDQFASEHQRWLAADAAKSRNVQVV